MRSRWSGARPQRRTTTDAGLAAFEARRLRVGRNMAARGRYLGAYMEAQLKSEEQRRQAERERTPDRVLETAMPFDYEAAPE